VSGLIDKVLAACDRKNVATGIFVQRPEDVGPWIKKGVRYLACSVDVGMFADISAARAGEMREQIEKFWHR
jgi:2-keto-3-deoxy-L-rhamnonate aldolase RhmA